MSAPQKLGHLARDRNNNLNLIRMIAALAVLVSHAHPIALGPGAQEPLEIVLGQSLGSLAVAVFFIISGYLIAESYMRAQSWQDFLVARLLRLWPALIVSLILVALVMGPLVTTFGPATYFLAPGTWSFLAKNLALYDPQYTLPGVFGTNPYTSVEGSIWTLFYEVACYIGLFAAGLIGLLVRQLWMTLALLLVVMVWLAVEIASPALPAKVTNMLTLGLPFAVGTGLWLWRDNVPLTFWGILGLLFTTVLLASTPLYGLSLILLLAYATFWLAYVPDGSIRGYNKLGDYSYGVYIYAFPAQGLAVWLFGPMTPLENMALALPLTVVPSILSWHLIEKPALARRRSIATWFT